ncbi:MAG TPA: anthranilate synthase component I family protein [Polyangiaceae bacterium]
MSFDLQPLDFPPDPFAIARSLSDREGVVLFFSDGGRSVYVGCDPLDVSRAIDPEPQLPRVAGMHGGAVPRWIGLVPYEACRQLELQGASDPRPEPLVSRPLWLRFGALACVANGKVVVAGDDPVARHSLRERLLAAHPASPPVMLRAAEPFEPGERHAERIRRALDHIGRGDIYEVNLARRLVLEVTGAPWDLLAALGTPDLPPHSFALRFHDLDVAAASPELCLRLEPDGRTWTAPIKGTRPRAADAQTDAALAAELEADPKERAELIMIVDVERNDFGRVARTGSVRLERAPHVVSLPSVHHRQAIVEAEIPSHVTRSELLSAMLPSGSVTGAPKRRAMQLIGELEPHRRGLYTGVVGAVRRDGGLELSMAIRTVVARNGVGHYFAGGGIVAESDPMREVEETRWKAERVVSLIARSTGRAEKWAD